MFPLVRRQFRKSQERNLMILNLIMITFLHLVIGFNELKNLIKEIQQFLVIH